MRAIDQSKNPDQEHMSDEFVRMTEEEYLKFRKAEQAMWDEVHSYETDWVMGEDGLEHPVRGARKSGK